MVFRKYVSRKQTVEKDNDRKKFWRVDAVGKYLDLEAMIEKMVDI